MTEKVKELTNLKKGGQISNGKKVKDESILPGNGFKESYVLMKELNRVRKGVVTVQENYNKMMRKHEKRKRF